MSILTLLYKRILMMKHLSFLLGLDHDRGIKEKRSYILFAKLQAWHVCMYQIPEGCVGISWIPRTDSKQNAFGVVSVILFACSEILLVSQDWIWKLPPSQSKAMCMAMTIFCFFYFTVLHWLPNVSSHCLKSLAESRNMKVN